MITKRWKDVAFDTLQAKVFGRTLWHVTIDAIARKFNALLGIKPAITFTLVTVHAAAGKQLSVSTLVMVWVMAIDAAHLRLLKASTL